VLIIGGIVSILTSEEKDLWNKVKLSPPWKYLIAFTVIAVISIVLTLVWDNTIIHLLVSFYRYGYLVIGGGQVVIPMMYSELVEINQYMTSQEFLTGFGFVQGLPGPMFNFSAYAAGMAARRNGTFLQILGALIGGVAIFLPGILLIYFVYPLWENLKKIKGIKASLRGITSVAGGLISISALILMQKSGFTWDNFIVLLLTAALLLAKKIPAPIIVGLVMAAGFLISFP